MSRGAIAKINLSALQHNLAVVRALAPKSKILAMIKSRAYGHGLIEMARALHKADALGVACLEEAMVLRAAGITNQIIAMSGFFEASEIPLFKKHNITAVIHNAEQVKMLEAAKIPLNCWLKLDTGMHRLGFPLKEADEVFAKIKPSVVMTHLASADEIDHRDAQDQIEKFLSVGARTWTSAVELSIVNSAGLVAFPEAQYQWVRPGILLYGASPFAHKTAAELNLRPVMTLQAQLISIHEQQAGDKIGYGGTYVCEKPMKIGTIAIGYGDGYPRHAKNGTPVLIHGQRCPIVGRVSMDLITIDLSNVAQAEIGDRVIMWGEGLPVDEVAACASTISYELLCDVSTRVKFEYIENPYPPSL